MVVGCLVVVGGGLVVVGSCSVVVGDGLVVVCSCLMVVGGTLLVVAIGLAVARNIVEVFVVVFMGLVATVFRLTVENIVLGVGLDKKGVLVVVWVRVGGDIMEGDFEIGLVFVVIVFRFEVNSCLSVIVKGFVVGVVVLVKVVLVVGVIDKEVDVVVFGNRVVVINFGVVIIGG